MIDSVRSTVLSAVNKNNFGYITPDDFNLFAKQAQIDIFEDYFYQYNTWINKMNNRQSGTGYADMVKLAEEVIDSLSSTATLDPFELDSNVFELPSDYYYVNTIRYGSKEIDRISHDKVLNLLSSNLTSPSKLYPVYTQEGSNITVYPDTITDNVKSQYIRIPKDPKWTYIMVNGSPVFNQNNDYQDFELPSTDEPLIVAKILKYAGLSIREGDVYQFGTNEQNSNKQIQG
jgi:hypothetical protein